jgi:hypothetical protein
MEHRFTAASRYIESLRHPAKKRYARDYYQWLRSGKQGDMPRCDHNSLGLMAEQAVWMNLNEIMEPQSV